jgi:hypothetical protein
MENAGIWNILRSFGVFYGRMVILWQFGIIFPRFGILFSKQSGNPDVETNY